MQLARLAGSNFTYDVGLSGCDKSAHYV
jgi:hypothetical protein